jgi:YVTN family beta-propeller protein
MKVIWKAACAAALLAVCVIEIGCGDVYRPIATVAPTTTGNPSGAETEVALNQCPPNTTCVNNNGLSSGSVLTTIDVSGDSNSGNKPVGNIVGSALGPDSSTATPYTTASPMAFDYNRTTVYAANPSTDSVSQLALNTTTGSFSANVTTITLEPHSAPLGMSFQYYGTTYKQDFVVNSGTSTLTCPSTGSLSVITQASATLAATVCVGPTPVFAWIYKDQSKVFVLDNSENQIYVVNASSYQVTNTITVGAAPIKAAQSNTGQYVYVVNSGNGTVGSSSISVINGQTETISNTVIPSAIGSCACSAPIIDIAQDPNFNDTTANSQVNHIWLLHADGTVSVWDGTVPGALTWITSISTIPAAQLAAKAYPTNLALMRDGSWAYVGVGNTDQIVGINTSMLATNAVTSGATTSITVGTHRAVSETGLSCNTATGAGCLEVTTPVVANVEVSRGGNSADISKVYAATTTTTTYYYYDASGNPTAGPTPPAWCTASGDTMVCPNLYNGTAVVSAASNGSTPVNSYITTITAPSVVTYCLPTDSGYDQQKDCPTMVPTMVLGRS